MKELNLDKYKEDSFVEELAKQAAHTLFGAGVHGWRKKDAEHIAETIKIAFQKLKQETADFDIICLTYDEEKSALLQGKVTDICRESCKGTLIGLVTKGIYFPEENIGIAAEQLTALFKTTYQASSALANGKDIDKFNTAKKQYLKSEPLRLKEWEFGKKQLEDIKVTIGTTECTLPVFINEEGVISPIINGEALRAFAQLPSSEKTDISLNEYLQKSVEGWNKKQVIAHITGEAKDPLSAFAGGPNLSGVNLSGSIIDKLYISNSDCTGMILRNCDIKHLQFEKCIYGGIDLRGADIDKIEIDTLQYIDPMHKEWSAEQLTEDKSNAVKIDTDLEKAHAAKFIHDSFYENFKDRAKIYDPFYSRAQAKDALAERVFLQDITQKEVQDYLSTAKDKSFNEFIIANRKLDAKKTYYTDLHKIDFTGLDLNGADFSFAYLAGVDFKGAANVSGLKCFKACLEGADFTGKDLSGSNFEQANMQYIKMESAKVEGCVFDDANMHNAKLTGIEGKCTAKRANLRFAAGDKANIICSYLSKIRAEGITLANAHLEHCIMIGADLTKAILTNSFFDGADLSAAILDQADAKAASFKTAKLEKVHAEFANFKSAIMESVEAMGADFSRADLSEIKAKLANFRQAKLDEIVADNSNWESARLEYATAIGARFKDAVMEGLQAQGINLAYAELIGVKAQQAKLTAAVLAHADAKKIDLTEADLSLINGEFADFEQACFEKANLHLAKLSAANLEGVKVNKANLDKVIIDPLTNLMSIDLRTAKNVDESLHKQQALQEWSNRPFSRAFDVISRTFNRVVKANKNLLIIAGCALLASLIGFTAIAFFPATTALILLTPVIVISSAAIGAAVGAAYNYVTDPEFSKKFAEEIKGLLSWGTAIGAMVGAGLASYVAPIFGATGLAAGAVIGGAASGMTVGVITNEIQEERKLLQNSDIQIKEQHARSKELEKERCQKVERLEEAYIKKEEPLIEKSEKAAISNVISQPKKSFSATLKHSDDHTSGLVKEEIIKRGL
jgi:uncharacterized protein YjbI with pentapeptide repeats